MSNGNVIIKGKLASNADGAPSRATIDSLNASMPPLVTALNGYRSQLTSIQAARSACSQKLISGPCYSANTDAQNDAIAKINSVQSSIDSLNSQIKAAEDAYAKATAAYAQSNPEIINAQISANKSAAETNLASTIALKAADNKKLIIIAVIVVVVIAITGFVWYKIKNR